MSDPPSQPGLSSRRGLSAAPSLQLRLRAGAGHWCQCHTSTEHEMDPHTPWKSSSMQRSRSIFTKARGIRAAGRPRPPCRRSEGQGVPVCLPQTRGK